MKLFKKNRLFHSFFIFLFFLSIFYPFNSNLYSQTLSFVEQDSLSLDDKARLIDYYWKQSKKAVFEGDYQKAIEQANLIVEIDPNNPDVKEFLNKITTRRSGNDIQEDFVNRANLFIKRQEKMSRLGVHSIEKKINRNDDYLSVEPSEEIIAKSSQVDVAKNIDLGINNMISKDDFDFFFSNDDEDQILIGAYKSSKGNNKKIDKKSKKRKKRKKRKKIKK